LACSLFGGTILLVVNEVGSKKLPLVVLAGSDAKPAQLPSGTNKHPVSGPKGMAIQLGGKPLIDQLLVRLKEADAFGPIFIAGPASAYGESRHGVEVIDTDGSFGENIATSVAFARQRCPGLPLAVTTCDILPDPEEMARMLADYRAHEPLDFWFPMILAPADRQVLGASSWKPQYRIAPTPGGDPIAILPGHLVIVDPASLRQGFINRSFELAYRSRNRPLLYRSFFIVGHLLLYLLGKDLRQILNLRVPSVTLAVIFQAIMMSHKLRWGTMTPDELARRFRLIFVRSHHRRSFPDRGGRVPLIDAISFAKDMDTQEEAEERAAEFEPDQGGSGGGDSA
jgi:hypothetical protein